MSFQAYLDNIEEKTGNTPNEFIAEAKKKNLTESRDIIAWLKQDYGLGLGHARALDYVIRKGATFELRHTTGTHRDASDTLQLEGKARSGGKSISGDLPAKLGAPAERALAGAGIKNLKQLTKFSEVEIKELHGVGPNALGKLRQALAEQGLSFKEKTQKSTKIKRSSS
ncbi:MAG TPA: DUF4287 domain-containing protein [Anaerolineales bacterium]|nr:DUF4287 domain-containing protein [Anaerolineales bacterium]